ncbi:MAG: pilus assembly protein [Proteobacteria bacterium]|nr:pilus assembly protein [Pseudomonadota bacterium]
MTQHSFLGNRDGAVMAEFALAGIFMIMLMMSVIELTSALWAWNSEAKAVQIGARLAAVSAPVSSDLATMTGLEGGATPGAAMPYFIRVCNGATSTCSGGSYSAAAMNWIVRGSDGVCGSTTGVRGICDLYPRIQPQNIVITYEQTGLGFAGRPGGPVPSITVKVQNLQFSTPVLGIFSGVANLTMPPVQTTVSGEDLRSTSP